MSLLAEGLGLLAVEVDLLAEIHGLLALAPRILAFEGGLLAKRDLLETQMVLAFRLKRKTVLLEFTSGRPGITSGGGGFTSGDSWVTRSRTKNTRGQRQFTRETGFIGISNGLGFSPPAKNRPTLILLAEGLGLLAVEVDLLAEIHGLLALAPRILAFEGSLLAKRDLLEFQMVMAFRLQRKTVLLEFTSGRPGITRGRGRFTSGDSWVTRSRSEYTRGQR